MPLRDHLDTIESLKVRLAEAQGYLGLEHLTSEKERLEAELSDPDIWTANANKARSLGAELAAANADLSALGSLSAVVDDAATLAELGIEEGDETLEPELVALMDDANTRLEELELRSLFSGEHDESDAVCELHAGQGGVDAQDWTNMMLRMYTRWAQSKGFEVELDEVSEGAEAGLMSATFIVKGRYAYGMLAAERGTHRLVRISPFDNQGRRQTSFAALTVTPFMEDIPDVTIEEKDIRVDTYRATGAGGQHINTTDSAIRITHFATGIVVTCQNQRSQVQNRDRAMQVLKAKLAEVAREQREAELAAIGGPKTEAAWGNQIRSYVLQPYQMVKDLRTEHETAKVDAVIDGDLDEFIEAWLRWRRTPAGAR